ncbi:hypothetical protein C672_2799 [[Clostridium] bifermentans ATCC 638]|uniref:Uncharacterized protein n=1 Tax=Paraclostridium bifermentans ATCC 638 = DSM 14991 TaxID=1233171 RepID=T4VRW3_PARBF|nr:hypothetical protein [Paraclostridium bifermentans]EQK43855.1 hypothetical protein C672_2799 [[Clostridium] bifermentans ATCC 638] [Paraclostridium bifermentans ATCC 638 = DSM 14991]RIZ59453.1 hypothetical protein CHH45_04955 [Paraclostridium bifermentans]UAG17680.1 hypothetical protein KXZ80_12985 [Paraclostridium bifermentans]
MEIEELKKQRDLALGDVLKYSLGEYLDWHLTEAERKLEDIENKLIFEISKQQQFRKVNLTITDKSRSQMRE